MANVIVNDTNLTNIANAIRSKNGTQTTYLPSEMATAIANIPSGGGSSVVYDGFYNGSTLIRGILNDVITSDPCLNIYGYKSGTQSLSTNNTTIGRGIVKYRASDSLTSSDVGQSIFSDNRLVSFTPPSSDPLMGNYYTGGPFLFQYGTEASLYRSYFFFRYNTVSYTENVSALTNTKVVTIDCEGTITGVFNTWTDLVTALSNKTIDATKGISIVGTTVTNTGQSTTAPQKNSIVFSA